MLNTAAYFGTTTTLLNPLAFSHVFPFPQASPNYVLGYSISGINYFYPQNQLLNYSIVTGVKRTTDVVLLFYTTNANKINLFSIYIMILQPGFTNIVISMLTMDFIGGWTFNQGTQYNVTWTGMMNLPLTATFIFYSITGLDAVVDKSF